LRVDVRNEWRLLRDSFDRHLKGINYDIHWNPVRIIQRFGRIHRIGSTNASIQFVNYWSRLSVRFKFGISIANYSKRS
jgi:hypothetical protein